MTFLKNLLGIPPDVDGMKAKRDINGLLKALSYPQNAEVRQAAARALGELREPRAVGALIRALEDEEAEVRWCAAESLFRIGEPALGPLIAAMDSDNAMVRSNVYSAIKQMDLIAVDPLIDALNNPSSNVRAGAAKMLAAINSARVVSPLIAAFDDGDPEVRRAVAEALGEIGGPEPVAVLKARLDNDPDAFVNDAITLALLKHGALS